MDEFIFETTSDMLNSMHDYLRDGLTFEQWWSEDNISAEAWDANMCLHDAAEGRVRVLEGLRWVQGDGESGIEFKARMAALAKAIWNQWITTSTYAVAEAQRAVRSGYTFDEFIAANYSPVPLTEAVWFSRIAIADRGVVAA